MTTPASKIVIVGGNRFPVDAKTDNEAIRQQLIAMGFADVANAEIKKGKQDGQETIEFVKKAGTKGFGPLDLAARLRRVPPAPAEPVKDMRLVNLLIDEQLTFEEAVADGQLLAALDELSDYVEPKGARLCRALDELSPVADSTPRGW